MKKLITFAIVRHALTAIGGILVAKGHGDSDLMQELAGVVLAALAGCWSAVDKYNARNAATRSAAYGELDARFQSPKPAKGGAGGLMSLVILTCSFFILHSALAQTFISGVKPRPLQYAPLQYDSHGNALPPVPGYSPDTNAPSVTDDLRDILNHVISSTSNLYFTPYISYVPDRDAVGGGLGIFYPATEHLVTGLRVEYAGQNVRGVSGSAALQLPIRVAKLNITPFAYAGIGYGLSGKSFYGVTIPGRPDDTVSAVTGYGASVMLYHGAQWTIGIVGDYETWHAYGQSQINVGPLFNYRW